MNKGETFIKGQELISQNRKFTAKIDQDSYFGVYYFNYALWYIKIAIDRFEMQQNGNFLIYDAQNNTYIKSNTVDKGDYFVLDNYGRITVYNEKTKNLWYFGSTLSK